MSRTYGTNVEVPDELQTVPRDGKQFRPERWTAELSRWQLTDGTSNAAINWYLVGNRVTKNGQPYRQEQTLRVPMAPEDVPRAAKQDILTQVHQRRTVLMDELADDLRLVSKGMFEQDSTGA